MKKKKIVNILRDNPMTLAEIAKELKQSRMHCKDELKNLHRSGIFIAKEKYGDTTRYYIPLKMPQIEPKKADIDYFGFNADWHIGNTYSEEECLLDYLDVLKESGVKYLFNAGDIFEGTNVYESQINDLLPDCITLQGQLEHFNKLYPESDKLQIYVVSGNHCLSNYKKQGIDPIKILSDTRKDIKYLGQYYGRMRIKDNIIVEMAHPTGVSPYGKSYRIQTYLRERPINTYPDILGLGHLHSSLFMDYQGTQSYQLGTFLGDTDFTRRRGLNPSIGGWIVELDIEDSKIKRNKSEWVKY